MAHEKPTSNGLAGVTDLLRDLAAPEGGALPIAPGTELAGRYRIERELGRGGMGRVFAAWDPKLSRRVAVKVLIGAQRHPQALARFEQEARAAGSLSHPNILAVHDVGTWQGEPFLVCELLEGETLRERLGRGALPAEQAVGLALQLAEGLAAAHAKGIVHRDLKPENAFLTKDGRLKILDFGIAKLLLPLDDPGAPTDAAPTLDGPVQTAAGAVIGTPQYMSPEQVQGQPVDRRTDLFAFGAILHELLTGKMAFGGRSRVEIAAAVVHGDPAPLPAAVPPSLAALVARCLSKDAAARPADAGEVAAALRSATLATHPLPPAAARPGRRRALFLGLPAAALLLALLAGPPLVREAMRRLGVQRIRSIAVLPLRNLSGEKAQEYFADGMTDELTTRLAQIGALRVISRTSAILYKDVRKPLRQIARELGVDGVIEGAVLASGDRVRLTAQLVDGDTEKSLWAETYERRLADVLALQGELARAVAAGVRARVTPEEGRRLAAAREVDPEVYRLYLAGRYHAAWGDLTPEKTSKAVTAFRQALTKDPGFAPAWAALALVYGNQGLYMYRPAAEAFADARAAAAKALALDPQSSEGHAALGMVKLMFDWDWAGAEAELKEAVALEPDNLDSRAQYSHLLTILGRHDEALASVRRAVAQAPLVMEVQIQLAWTLHYAHRFDESIAKLKQLLELQPANPGLYMMLAWNYTLKGANPEALAAADRLAKLMKPGTTFFFDIALVLAWGQCGRRAAARELVAAWEARQPKEHLDAGGLATMRAAVGDLDQAFAWLDRAFAERSVSLYVLRVETLVEPLRADPRFAAYVARLKLPP